MKKRLLWAVLILAAAALVVWAVRHKSEPPEITFTKVHRETLISNLITNGKAEPLAWQDIRVDNQGLVSRVPVKEGQTVTKGALVAQLNEPGLSEDLSAAEAREQQARANLQTLTQGGKSVELAQIESDLEHTRVDHDQALKEYNSLRRLHDKQAATTIDVEIAHEKLRETELAQSALEKRRESLVSKQDVAAATARVAETQALVQQARGRLAQGAIYAPIAGVVYSLPVRPGTYLNPGDLVASIGNIDHLRVRVYVDEPELGRVRVAQPVKITWDGLPGRAWDGAVEKKPAAIVPLGTRQVGEVQVTIDNPNHDLVPGTNINAEIRTSLVPNALVVPKECMHRENSVIGVYLLQEDRVKWRPVKVGAASVTRAQIVEGLQDGDLVAMPSDHALKDGDPVRPIIQ
jgi:HlyD family secretion protein